uniref:Uncharacterized protein n=1 Tax=Plectus sambesii TaxID=2011161 RepID=A0A914W878_9BILA
MYRRLRRRIDQVLCCSSARGAVGHWISVYRALQLLQVERDARSDRRFDPVDLSCAAYDYKEQRLLICYETDGEAFDAHWGRREFISYSSLCANGIIACSVIHAHVQILLLQS